MDGAGVLRWAAIAVAAGAALWVLDRGLLAMEARGWIYYRRRRGSAGTLGAAFLSVQSLIEPGKRHVVGELRRDESEDDASGDPPLTGGGAR